MKKHNSSHIAVLLGFRPFLLDLKVSTRFRSFHCDRILQTFIWYHITGWFPSTEQQVTSISFPRDNFLFWQVLFNSSPSKFILNMATFVWKPFYLNLHYQSYKTRRLVIKNQFIFIYKIMVKNVFFSELFHAIQKWCEKIVAILNVSREEKCIQ